MADGYPHSLMFQSPLPAGATLSTTVGDFPIATTSSGGGALTSQNVNSNQQIGTTQLPAGGYIDSVTLRELTNTAGVTLSIGSTPGGNDIMASQAVSAGQGVYVTSFSKTNFASGGSRQTGTLYVSSSSWTTAKINVQINYVLGP